MGAARVASGLKVLEDAAATILPLGYHVDYTGSRASCARNRQVLAAMASRCS